MASVIREVQVACAPEAAWTALRDVGQAHRLFAGVLTDARLAGDVRTVTFAEGAVVRERIIAVDDEHRRVAYAVLDPTLVHHGASMQILPGADGVSRFLWITDVLPDDRAARIAPLMDRGCAALRHVLENRPP